VLRAASATAVLGLGLWLGSSCAAAKAPEKSPPPPARSAPASTTRAPSPSRDSEPVSSPAPEPEPDGKDGTKLLANDPTISCNQREPVPSPPGYRPRTCERVTSKQQSSYDEPYLLWDFAFGFYDYPPCPGYRYSPSFLSLVDVSGRVLWCRAVPFDDRERRLESSAVDNHRFAPWARPIVPWRLLGGRVLLFRDDTLVELDEKTGRELKRMDLARRSVLPPYDQANFSFKVGKEQCDEQAGPGVVVRDCGGLVLWFSPNGFVMGLDARDGKRVETLEFSENHVKPSAKGPNFTLTRKGKRFSMTLESALFLQ